MARRNLNGTAASDFVGAAGLPEGDWARSFLGDGDDRFDGSSGGDQAYGDAGNDLLFGFGGDDSLYGGLGADQLRGGDGVDSLDGGDGDDVLLGEDGNDRLLGGLGADNLSGGAGDDTLLGGSGSNTLDGGAGADLIEGGSNDDRASGGEGDDTIRAGDGRNTVTGGSGNDDITAGTGDDWVAGEDGDDRINVGNGRNAVLAGTGNDTVTAGTGDDTIVGDDGDDVIAAGAGHNGVQAGEGNDRVAAGSGDDTIFSAGGNDTIEAGNGANSIQAGLGDDVIVTGGGADTILGDEGHDRITSGAGNDLVHGNGGDDVILLGAGNDTVVGGEGRDGILGGAGADQIHGDGGDDTLDGGVGTDHVSAGAGDDLVAQAIADRGVPLDTLLGGSGYDVLHLAFTRAEWFNLQNQTELARIVAAFEASAGPIVTSARFGATFREFEALGASVDGVALSAADDPVLAVDDVLDIGEAGGGTLDVTANDVVPDLVRDVLRMGPVPSPGVFSLSAAGLLAFDSGRAFEYLAGGEVATLSLRYRVRDADYDADIGAVTIRVTGENDAVAFGEGDDRGSVLDGENHDAAGTIAFTDPDLRDSHDVQVTEEPGAPGAMTAVISNDNETDGVGAVTWSYVADPTDIAFLRDGESRDYTFTLRLNEYNLGAFTSTATRDVVVTVTGVNDAAFIGGDDEGAVEEDGTLSASGTLAVSDADTGEAVFATPALLAGSYGAFTFEATTGVWTYALANGSAAVQGLSGGDVVTDTLTVSSFDGTDSHDVVVTVTGTADAAVVSGPTTGSVAEDGTLSTGGTLSVTDADDGEGHFVAPAAVALTGTYGAFTFDAATGAWAYALNNARAQRLDTGAGATETLTVATADGTTTTLSVGIAGINDAPVLVTQNSHGGLTVTERADGAVDESTAIHSFADRRMHFSDADAADSHTGSIQRVAVSGGFIGPALGTASVTSVTSSLAGSTGTVFYDFAVADSALDHLSQGESVVTRYRVAASDGTASAVRNVDVTHVGRNDAVAFTGADASATVTDGGTSVALGTLGFADPDRSDTHALAITPPSDALGTFSASISDGNDDDGFGTVSWSFSVDPAAIRHLGADESLTQTYTLSLADSYGAFTGAAATRTVTVSIEGRNDAPTSVTLLGNDGVDEGTAPAGGTLIGTLAGVDPDVGDTLTYGVNDARFAVLGGKLYLKEGASLDHETEPAVALTLTATDAGGLSTSSNVTLAVGDIAERHTPVVGVYDGVGWYLGTGSAGFARYVSSLGLTPVILSGNPTPAQLSALDAVVMDVYGSFDADVMPAVSAGLKLVVNDWNAAANSTIRAAFAAPLVSTQFDFANVDVINEGSWIANGPGGRLSDSSLDGGSASTHGAFTLGSVLANGAMPILSSIADSNVTAFEISYGAGKILYTAMPVSAYVGSAWVAQSTHDGMQAWFRNEIANAVRQPGATRNGDAADNAISGGDGDDVLFGGGGNDVLSGGLGFDRLTGGAGADRFVFGSPAGMTDVVTDFVGVEDLIILSAAGFGGLTPGAVAASLFTSNTNGAATTAAQRFIYETDSRVLWYDPDGTGSVASTMILRLDNGASLAASDLLLV